MSGFDTRNLHLECQKCAGSMGILVSADAKELGVFLDRNKGIPYCNSCHKRGVYDANWNVKDNY